MKEYRTTKIVDIFCGKIGLTDAQAAVRARSLRSVRGKGVYEIISPVQFKAGEIIRLPEVDKIIRESLECLEPDAAELEEK